jgi:protein TonB
MDEAALMKFLDGESKLTPEEQIELTDNIENLINEYEPEFEPKAGGEPKTGGEPKAAVKGEIQPVEAKPETGATPKGEPIEGVKKPEPKPEPKPKAEPKPTAEKGIEDVPKNEKRKLLNSNFEKLLNNEEFYKEFKIKSKCL